MPYVNNHEKGEKKSTLDSIFKSPNSYRDPNQRVKKKTTQQGMKYKQIALYPLNSQIIDKSPPSLMLRDLRGLNICVFVQADIPELL